MIHTRGEAKSTLSSVAILLIAAALSACHREPPPATIPTVTVGTVLQRTGSQGERYSATINPNAQVQLAFKSGGIVNYIRKVRGPGGRERLIDAGDPIVEGQDLARVRITEYEAQLHQEQSQVLQADAQLQGAQAAETQAKLNYDRANALYSEASLTKPNYDQAKSSYDQATAAVDQAKAAGASARAAVAQVQVAVGDTAVRAPFNGSVVQRNVEVGDLAGASNTAFVVIDTHVVKAIFAIPESALGSVHRGQRLNITLDTPPLTVSGIVTSIAPAADPKSRVFSVELTLPNPQRNVLPGTIGSLALAPSGPPATRSVVVPLSAVVQSSHPNGALGVLLVQERDGHTYAHLQDIRAGDTFGDSVEVESGVKAGQRIITVGAQLVHDGDEVRILQSE
jgi:RND family efflux transporter MFP subunit